MRYLHEATNEWMDEVELQERIDHRFNLKCNECHKTIGDHVAVAAQGIFCKPCQVKLVKDVQGIVEGAGGTFHKL